MPDGITFSLGVSTTKPTRFRHDRRAACLSEFAVKPSACNAVFVLTLALLLAAVPTVPAGETFACAPQQSGMDGPVWCAEGPRVRLAGIAAREADGTFNSNQPCPDATAEQARDTLAAILGTPGGFSAHGHRLVSGPTMRCRSTGSAGGNRMRITHQRGRELRYGAIRHSTAVGSLLGQPSLLGELHYHREHGQRGEESEPNVKELHPSHAHSLGFVHFLSAAMQLRHMLCLPCKPCSTPRSHRLCHRSAQLPRQATLSLRASAVRMVLTAFSPESKIARDARITKGTDRHEPSCASILSSFYRLDGMQMAFLAR